MAADYLARSQRSRMEESYFRIGPEGKRFIEKTYGKEVVLERRPPVQLAHFRGINDIRLSAEEHPSLLYFFAFWELPACGWRHSIIPDAILAIPDGAFAVEFDRGEESLRYFAKTKVVRYDEGLPGFPIRAVLVVADRKVRMDALRSHLLSRRVRVLFSVIDLILAHGIWGQVFFERDNEIPVSLSPDPLVDKRGAER